jgi:vacuolar-type H+-ATPase subunit B/Vma2
METGLVRHDHEQLAGVLLRWYARVREDAKAELR